MASVFQTWKRHGCAVQFSPFSSKKLLCATSANFSIAGSGTLFYLQLQADGMLALLKALEWSNSLFDVSWSESAPQICITGSGDGLIHMWDLEQPNALVQSFQEHTKEVYGVQWNIKQPNIFLSASWDKVVKLWDVKSSQSLSTFVGHDDVVYSSVWSPLVPGCFASCSGDGTLRVWDIRKPYMAHIIIAAHSAEVLTCDWCKYNPNLLFTGATDKQIRGWDLRQFKAPVCELSGHALAVRKLKCSPFHGSVLASSSYDLTVNIWDLPQTLPVQVIEHHSEFVCGLDFNLHLPGQIADCSWDETVKVYSPHYLQQKQ